MQVPGVASALTTARFELKKEVFSHSRALRSPRATPKPPLQHLMLPAPAPRHPPVRMTPGRNKGLDLSANQFPQQLLPHSPVRAHPIPGKARARLEGSVLLWQRPGQRKRAGARARRTEPGGGRGHRLPRETPAPPAPSLPRTGWETRHAEPHGRSPGHGSRGSRSRGGNWELRGTPGSTRTPSPGVQGGRYQGHSAPSRDAAAAPSQRLSAKTHCQSHGNPQRVPRRGEGNKPSPAAARARSGPQLRAAPPGHRSPQRGETGANGLGSPSFAPVLNLFSTSFARFPSPGPAPGRRDAPALSGRLSG